MATEMTFRPGLFRELEEDVKERVVEARVVERIAARDHTLWKPAPDEITNRLGWFDISRRMLGEIEAIDAVVEEIKAAGYDFALLFGMGGSSLAPEVYRKVFGVAGGYLNLEVLDSTDPGAVIAYSSCLDLEKTLFIVSTKSGGTVETLSLMKYFYNLTAEELGRDRAGEHFIAITDPGSKLEATARQNSFRHIFLGDPEIGGRYSALSLFGLVPARLLGIDIRRLLENAETCREEGEAAGALLGGLLGEMALRGFDKLTFVFSQRYASLGGWIEQLIAESTGKEGKGIVPVVVEPSGAAEFYGADRLFCSVRMAGDAIRESHLRTMAAAGHPVVDLTIADNYDLGAHFFFWEMATAVAGWVLAVNPFDQPNVETAKVLTRDMVERYLREKALPEEAPVVKAEGFSIYGPAEAGNPLNVLREFLSGAASGAYVAFMAYLAPSPWIEDAMQRLRGVVVQEFFLATTFGYGPRFLHSTGQLHKGDAGRGIFVQFTADDPEDADIPDGMESPKSSLSFGILKRAQAKGDMQALLAGGRKLIRIHLGGNPARDIDRLTKALTTSS